MTSLSYERISHANPTQWIFVVHGFLGRGANWRSFARKLVEQKPSFGAALIDLRLHGASQNFPAPHNITAAAQDLVRLREEFSEPVRAIIGHSFGAKVALNFVELTHENLNTAWLIDSVPWALNPKTSASLACSVLNILEPLTYEIFSSRQAFITRLELAGLDQATSQWLAMNLQSSELGFTLRLQPLALKALLDDYFKQDLTYILSNITINTQIYFALGNKSKLLNSNDRLRITNISEKHKSHMHTYILEDAGHDVHIDSQDELLELVLKSLNY